MTVFFSALAQLGSTFLGASVFFGLMWYVLRANARMWRLVAAHYAGKSGSPVLSRKVPETIIVTAAGKTGSIIKGNLTYRLYAGAGIAIHADGLSLSLIPPFGFAQRAQRSRRGAN